MKDRFVSFYGDKVDKNTWGLNKQARGVLSFNCGFTLLAFCEVPFTNSQWCGDLMFSLLLAVTRSSTNSRFVSDSRRHDTYVTSL